MLINKKISSVPFCSVPFRSVPFRSVPLLVAIFSILIYSCAETNNSAAVGCANGTPTFTVNEISAGATKTIGNYTVNYNRARFTTVSLAVDSAYAECSYKIGIRAATEPAPSVADMNSNPLVFTRTLQVNAINLYLPFHMDGEYLNTGQTASVDLLRSTMLTPSTSYKLYIASSSTVYKILEFSTDALPSTATKSAYGLPNDYTTDVVGGYTVRAGEPFAVWFGQSTVGYTGTMNLYVGGTKLIRCVVTTCTWVGPNSGTEGYIIQNGGTPTDEMFIIKSLLATQNLKLQLDDGSNQWVMDANRWVFQ